ncbi:uncharacterized protein ColSpa_04020 [Colletotrichum spaethianum]|uniref:Uncharacterized protein n=1 Tax=Colletotrichum spaethianum TaxID=700344 RepID=A0AA37LAP5_9PEZI|nr:uncharacterized protein ColSpa_04020 [Colletotrichum spaethianum]GKT43839.1 hypothetical protein ColSpa_04020 [Colletotrichum spaethianum]
MAGANTFFRSQQGPSSPSPADKPLPPPSARKQTKSNIIVWPGQFEQKLLESVDKIIDPELLGAIGEDKNVLVKRIADSTWHIRFSAAILTGHLSPAQIAHASTEAGLDNLVSELSQLDDNTFHEKLGLRKRLAKEPDV